MANENGTNFKTLNSLESQEMLNVRYLRVFVTKSPVTLSNGSQTVDLLSTSYFEISADDGNTFDQLTIAAGNTGEAELFWY